MTVKLLNELYLEFVRLKGGCTSSSESTLVKMPHCLKSHVTAHIYLILHKWCLQVISFFYIYVSTLKFIYTIILSGWNVA